MILATTTVEDVDRFLDVFGTKGADKRALHGSKGSTVFRDPDRGEPRLGAVRLGREGGRASSPTPRSRRSSRKPDTWAKPAGRRCCSAPTGREGRR